METHITRPRLSVRKAVKADARILAALHKESFGTARWSLKQILDSLVLETTLALVAQEGKTAWGFALCQIVKGDAEILTFCISPAARRAGSGNLLLSAALEEMRQNKALRVFLEVASDNLAAMSLYEKAGFRATGKRKGYYKREARTIDAVMMELVL